jgi:hypothetical protein
MAAPMYGQTCTTQARMQPAVRQALADAALAIGSAVKAGDPATVKAATVPELAANFGSTEFLIRSTSQKLSGETLRVTQVYELDATARKAGDASSADFSCALKDTSSETDFSISGLPPGDFGFAMVETSGGEHPWLLSLLLQREGSAWKMAGFYPKARSAAGHDGLWYWNAARQRAGAKEALLSWLYYSQAETLLQPAPFADSTNLDKLRNEQRGVAPPEIAGGLSAATPMVLKGAGGSEFKVISLGTETATDDKSLHLLMHVAGVAGADEAVLRGRGEGAARALVAAHPELKQAFGAVYVFTDLPQGNAPVVSLTMTQIQ